MEGKRWKEIAETLKDNDELYVYFFSKEDADEALRLVDDDVFTVAEWSKIVDKMDNDKYMNHVIWESFYEIVNEAIKERKGHGNN